MAKKNKLQYIILGLLNQEPLSGYDITKAFTTDIGEFWQAGHSQIYPALKIMEKDGYITHEIEIAGTKLEKKIYSITSQGKKVLMDWLVSDSGELKPIKDEFILKLYFIKNKDDVQLQQRLIEQLQLHQVKLDHLEGRMKLIFFSEEEINKQYGHYLILDHAIEREKYCVKWFKKYLN
ncbi:PadR family transcriptional regulator [Dellaglioa sp. P0083]|uniref:PadR family transcriptional regulator n=1 Tax=Dellaglioa kimchii TaxID=3344667 RepID=UPI0038D4F269